MATYTYRQFRKALAAAGYPVEEVEPPAGGVNWLQLLDRGACRELADDEGLDVLERPRAFRSGGLPKPWGIPGNSSYSTIAQAAR